jgi:hypothetical protein
MPAAWTVEQSDAAPFITLLRQALPNRRHHIGRIASRYGILALEFHRDSFDLLPSPRHFTPPAAGTFQFV